MTKLIATAIAAALALAAPAFADDAHHPEQAADAKKAPAKPAPQVKQMQDNVKKMQAQLGRVAKAKTDGERQQAMAEHMQTMQENMKMAHAMKAGPMDCAMMEGGVMGMMPGMMGSGAPSGPTDRMQQMEKRMDMMQMMMKQMTRRQDGGASAHADEVGTHRDAGGSEWLNHSTGTSR